jgi:hypothetical protein
LLGEIDSSLLHLEARFSHEKRMEKIVAVFSRTLELIGGERASIVRAFAEACPPVAIGRLENARQFHNFLSTRWRREPPKLRYLPDLAVCELAFAEARNRSDPKQPVGGVPIGRNRIAPLLAVRRSSGVVLVRCGYDIRAIFATGIRHAPAKRHIALAIATPSGAADPHIFELDYAIFDLVAALNDWTERRVFGETLEAEELIANLAAHGLLELRA